ncbi:unnamed protein product [Closterium sp. NIES-54]
MPSRPQVPQFVAERWHKAGDKPGGEAAAGGGAGQGTPPTPPPPGGGAGAGGVGVVGRVRMAFDPRARPQGGQAATQVQAGASVSFAVRTLPVTAPQAHGCQSFLCSRASQSQQPALTALVPHVSPLLLLPPHPAPPHLSSLHDRICQLSSLPALLFPHPYPSLPSRCQPPSPRFTVIHLSVRGAANGARGGVSSRASNGCYSLSLIAAFSLCSSLLVPNPPAFSPSSHPIPHLRSPHQFMMRLEVPEGAAAELPIECNLAFTAVNTNLLAAVPHLHSPFYSFPTPPPPSVHDASGGTRWGSSRDSYRVQPRIHSSLPPLPRLLVSHSYCSPTFLPAPSSCQFMMCPEVPEGAAAELPMEYNLTITKGFPPCSFCPTPSHCLPPPISF